MQHISIISASVRPDRQSHRVALYFKNYLTENNLASVEILDLKEFDFPIFSETLKKQANPSEKALEFAKKIKTSKGIIMVTPEYNGSYPASLKNTIDLLYDEWRHKPVAIATVSAGPFGGSQALVSLQFTLWKMKAWTITEMFSVPNVHQNYDDAGKPTDKSATDKLAEVFIKELMWCVKADNSKI
ncbi:NAD(P)H-dependent oxidoreductase [Emticicia sediminis]